MSRPQDRAIQQEQNMSVYLDRVPKCLSTPTIAVPRFNQGSEVQEYKNTENCFIAR